MKNLEILKGVLSAETYALVEKETAESDIQLCDLSTGDYVSKQKYSALEASLQQTQGLLDTKTKEYDTLKAGAGDNEQLKADIENLKTNFETEKSKIKDEYEKQLKSGKIAAKIIQDYRPKDVNDVLRHVDMEKITIDGDTFSGLEEQIKPLQESKAYYFSTENSDASGFNHDNGEVDDSALRASFGLPEKS